MNNLAVVVQTMDLMVVFEQIEGANIDTVTETEEEVLKIEGVVYLEVCTHREVSNQLKILKD